MTPDEQAVALRRWRGLVWKEAIRAKRHDDVIFDAEDLAQIGFLAVLQGLEEYDPTQSNPWTWLSKKVRWAMYSYIRENKHGRRKLDVDVYPADEETIVFLDDRTTESPEDSDLLALQDFLRWWVRVHSPPMHHRVLVAHRLSGHTLMEAGHAAGVSESRGSQIMKDLEQLAQEYGRSQESSGDD